MHSQSNGIQPVNGTSTLFSRGDDVSALGGFPDDREGFIDSGQSTSQSGLASTDHASHLGPQPQAHPLGNEDGSTPQIQNTQLHTPDNEMEDIVQTLPIVTLPPPRRSNKPTVTVVSHNVNGGLYGAKFGNLHDHMRDNHIGLALVQETHMSESQAAQMQANFQRLLVFASPTPDHESSRGGIACLVNREIMQIESITHTVLEAGRAALITIVKKSGSVLCALNIYAPATTPLERTQFYQRINKYFEDNRHARRPLYMGGDFNMVEEGLDRSSGKDTTEHTANAFSALKMTLRMQDSYRLIDPDTRNWTFSTAQGEVWSRLDRIYICVDLIPYLHSATIEQTAVNSDHLMVQTVIERPDAPYLGKSVWTFPTNLLRNTAVNKIIDALLTKAKRELTEMRVRTNQYNPQLILSNLKIGIQKAIREYDKKKAAMGLNKAIQEAGVIKCDLMADPAGNSRELFEVNKHLHALLFKRDESHKKRVRAKHFVEGRRAGKYTSSINKPIHAKEFVVSLKKVDGEDAARERDIRHEQLRDMDVPNQAPARETDDEKRRAHIEQLRAQTHVIHSEQIATEFAVHHIKQQKQDMDAPNVTNQDAIDEVLAHVTTKLTESQRNELREPMTLDDLERTLLLMPSDSSPGPDGLSAEIWKHFLKRHKNKTAEDG